MAGARKPIRRVVLGNDERGGSRALFDGAAPNVGQGGGDQGEAARRGPAAARRPYVFAYDLVSQIVALQAGGAAAPALLIGGALIVAGGLVIHFGCA